MILNPFYCASATTRRVSALDLSNPIVVHEMFAKKKGVRLFVVERPRLVRDDSGPLRLTTKPCSVFTRDDEGFDHLGVDKVSVKVDEFC